jgi:hypothetical protein
LTFHPVPFLPKEFGKQHVMQSLAWVMVLFLLRLKSKTLWWRYSLRLASFSSIFMYFVTCKTFFFFFFLSCF